MNSRHTYKREGLSKQSRSQNWLLTNVARCQRPPVVRIHWLTGQWQYHYLSHWIWLLFNIWV